MSSDHLRYFCFTLPNLVHLDCPLKYIRIPMPKVREHQVAGQGGFQEVAAPLYKDTQNTFFTALLRKNAIFSPWFLECSWPWCCKDRHKALSWVVFDGTSLGRAEPAAQIAGGGGGGRWCFLPSSASAPPHTQLFHRLCTGTRIWALINRIISYEFLLPLSVGCFLRAVGLTSLP